MKNSGITRHVDELGRIVIPIELRNKFGISEKDPMEVFVDGSTIVLKKFEPNCIFCGNSRKLSEYKDKLICQKCLQQIKAIQDSEITEENR
ncbi:MAG: AbrB/MazE/SpoVT family DNA-binding domain-containing protein [Clostridia bacterium]|jgi:transcriptional pleiotropic regulator of transition state genes|nr:AbrB/MazE/SpoVT family DNA-binding domain-containing protein [Clostridia bacterium]